MSRASDSARRNELAEELADYFIAIGNVRESLREIAPALGTSARMLLHYFETRDEMAATALEVARARQLAAAEKALEKAVDVEALMNAIWKWYKRADTQQFFVLFSDVAALERSQAEDSRQFGARLGSEWTAIFEPPFRADVRYAKSASAMAKLIVATIRGLALDLRNGVEIKDQHKTYLALVDLIL